MGHKQRVWVNQGLGRAREILVRLGPTAEARAARAGTDPERGYLRAVAILFGSGERAARDRAYAAEMGRLAASYPEDLEAQSFFALAPIATLAPSPPLFASSRADPP